MCYSYHQPFSNAIVQCDLSGRIIYAEKILCTLVQLAEAMCYAEVEYARAQVLYTAAINNAGSLERGRYLFLFCRTAVVEHVHQAICLCIALRASAGDEYSEE